MFTSLWCARCSALTFIDPRLTRGDGRDLRWKWSLADDPNRVRWRCEGVTNETYMAACSRQAGDQSKAPTTKIRFRVQPLFTCQVRIRMWRCKALCARRSTLGRCRLFDQQEHGAICNPRLPILWPCRMVWSCALSDLTLDQEGRGSNTALPDAYEPFCESSAPAPHLPGNKDIQVGGSISSLEYDSQMRDRTASCSVALARKP